MSRTLTVYWEGAPWDAERDDYAVFEAWVPLELLGEMEAWLTKPEFPFRHLEHAGVRMSRWRGEGEDPSLRVSLVEYGDYAIHLSEDYPLVTYIDDAVTFNPYTGVVRHGGRLFLPYDSPGDEYSGGPMVPDYDDLRAEIEAIHSELMPGDEDAAVKTVAIARHYLKRLHKSSDIHMNEDSKKDLEDLIRTALTICHPKAAGMLNLMEE